MRWFRHLSSSHEDELLAEIIDEFGAAGYGAWWLIMEQIAMQMDDTDRCSCRYSASKWKQVCALSSSKFNRFVNFLKKNEKICIQIEEKYITIKNPNLLKYKDEYSLRKSKKSGENPDSVGSLSVYPPSSLSLSNTNIYNNIDNIRERDGYKFSIEEGFNIFYTEYPLKKSKAAAKKAFIKLKPDDQLLDKILKALEMQKKEREIQISNGEKPTFWKHPATWLNNECWEDAVDLNYKKNLAAKDSHKTTSGRFISSMKKIHLEGL